MNYHKQAMADFNTWVEKLESALPPTDEGSRKICRYVADLVVYGEVKRTHD